MNYRGLTLLLVCGLSGVTFAGESPNCPNPISFALYENGYIYEAASNSGIDKDVAEELAKRSGCRFEYSVKPRARIWHELENGTLMMTGSGIQTEARDAFSWVIRYMAQKNYVVLDKSLTVNDPGQFASDPSLIWGAVRSYKHGSAADAYLEQLRNKSRVVDEADLGTVFKAFAYKRSSALFAPPPAYAKYVKEMNLGARIRVEDWFPEDLPIPHGLIFSKKYFSADEIKKWRAIVSQMRADGTLEGIYKKYLGPLDSDRMLQYKAN